MPFSVTWMQLKIIILSEVSRQRKRNTINYHLPVDRWIWGNGNPLQYSCLGNLVDRGARSSVGSHSARHDWDNLAYASTEQRWTHRHRDQPCGCQGDEGGRRMDREFGISRCKLVYIGWVNNKVILYTTRNYIQCPVIKGIWNEYTHTHTHIHTYICITESLCCTSEIITAL